MTRPEEKERLVLASASRVRARLLEEAGVAVDVCAAAIDESQLKEGLKADGAGAERVAEILAEMKAAQVSGRFPGRLVLGVDQMLECGSEWLEKPRDVVEAGAQLRKLRGRSHTLYASAVLMRDRRRLWHAGAKALMTMRDFSDGFLQDYLATSGEGILSSVGAYQMEAMGAQLFQKVEGDFFTILGLPLLPIIEALRDQGLLRR